MSENQAKWSTFRVEEIQAKEKYALNGGPFGSKLVSKMYVEEGVPVIRGTNLPLDSRFCYDGFVYVSEVKAAELAANTAKPGDVIFTQRGTLGQVGIIPINSPYKRFVISQSQMKLTVDPDKADANFIYYYFRESKTAGRVIALASSSGVPHINLETLRKFEIRLPPVSTQHRIASILSAYDDLIENNTRRITILEEMAKRLYEEWFVHFRFPGCPESTFGFGNLGDLIEVVRGRSYKGNELAEDSGRPFVNLKCIERDGGFRRDGLKRYTGAFKANQLVRKGDIVMAVTDMTQERRIVARSALVPNLGDGDGVVSMDLVKIVPRDPAQNVFIYSYLRWSDFADTVKNHATGANVLHLHPDLIASHSLSIPKSELVKQFSSVVRPLLDLAESLAQRCANLRAQRDLLLPKLISGEIDASRFTMPDAADPLDA